MRGPVDLQKFGRRLLSLVTVITFVTCVAHLTAFDGSTSSRPTDLQTLNQNDLDLHGKSNFLRGAYEELDSSSSSSGARIAVRKEAGCEETWGIFPCSNSLWGNLFLMCVYGGLLLYAAMMISDASDLMLQFMGAGVIGALVLPVLGALPDSMIIIFSSIGGTREEAQEEVKIGLGTLAGSTIMLLTIAFGSCGILARTDMINGKPQNHLRKPPLGKVPGQSIWDLEKTGVVVENECKMQALLMCGTAALYLVIQVPAFTEPETDRMFALVGMILCILALLGYCVFQLKYPEMVEMKAEESRLIALEGLAEQALLKFSKEKLNDELISRDGKVNNSVLVRYFEIIDVDKSGDIDEKELEKLLTMLKIVPTKEKIEAMLKQFDSDGDGKINQQEFINGMTTWLIEDHQDQKKIEESIQLMRDEDTYSTPMDEEDEDEEEEEDEYKHITDPAERLRKLKMDSVLFLLGGILLSTVFSDPMVDSISNFSKASGISPFFVSFVVTPFASNASEFVSSLIQASRKHKKNITLTISQIFGAATMNNTMCLGIFLGLVYFRKLLWLFSAEVFSILIVTWIVGALGASRVVYKLWQIAATLLLYPAALVIVVLIQKWTGE
jgi:Ca2+/Na+ antiporter